MTEADTRIKVLVRVRPLLPREKEEHSDSLVTMPPKDPTTTQIRIPETSSFSKRNGEDTKTYRFDECIWSFDVKDEHYVDNTKFYNKTGPDIINHFFQGFNVCLLAYGQTSSGKTHTMMGERQDPGLIPLIVRDILRHKEVLVASRINCEVKFSYSEIYNEQVKDLLEPGDKKCRVREHPVTGPYVENLHDVTINDYEDFQRMLRKGNVNRTTASTSMNELSSRSHAIITLTLKQTKFSEDSSFIGDAEEEMISNIKLVDLAGSERLAKTKIYGQADRIKEGTQINKSLAVLGRCINILSNNTSAPKPSVVPYRDSTLTYLLKENLGGNSKSFMIFCVSPVDFEESYQTLNYATQVKNIKTTAKANKTKLSSTPVDWKELQRNDLDVVESLKREIEELTLQLNNHNDVKVSKFMAFFETESKKIRFENKFLKQQLKQKDQEISELNNHVNYIENEYGRLNQEIHTVHLEHKLDLQARCATALGQINDELQQFDLEISGL